MCTTEKGVKDFVDAVCSEDENEGPEAVDTVLKDRSFLGLYR